MLIIPNKKNKKILHSLNNKKIIIIYLIWVKTRFKTINKMEVKFKIMYKIKFKII